MTGFTVWLHDGSAHEFSGEHRWLVQESGSLLISYWSDTVCCDVLVFAPGTWKLIEMEQRP